MPIKLPNGSTYKICLLDTNVLSEIIKHPKIEGFGYLNAFSPSEFIPSFTVYNLIELRRKTNIFKNFVAMFDVIPCILFDSWSNILSKEVTSKGKVLPNDIIHQTFTPANSFSKFVDEFFTASIEEVERNWRKNDQHVLDVLINRKANFVHEKPTPNAQDGKRFVHAASIDTLIQLHPDFVKANIANSTDLPELPSLQTMLYSQYYRIFDEHWKPNNQEATDVYISACAPYVDIVITEKFQSEIYRKISKIIANMPTIKKIKDIR